MLEYKLIGLDPVIRADLDMLSESYAWIMARPWAFPFTGGGQNLGDYLLDSLRPTVKQLGILQNGRFTGLITIIKEDDAYMIHVTSPRRTSAALVADASRAVIHHLFKAFNAQTVYTSAPIYKSKHIHIGSFRLCRACGAKPTGDIETDEFNNQWVRFEITRRDWQAIYAPDDPEVSHGRKNKDPEHQPADRLLFQ